MVSTDIKLFDRLSSNERAHVRKLSKKHKDRVTKSLTISKKTKTHDLPLRLQILTSHKLPETIKQKLFEELRYNDSDKYYQYVKHVMELPFDTMKTPLQQKDMSMSSYLQNACQVMDSNITGNDNVKNEVLKLLCQWKLSGSCSGYALAFEGKPGVGKTHFVKSAFAQAMGLPVAFIGLGGCTDSSYLEGNLYTYEGSIYGRLAQALIETKCKNPIIFIDEVDKVSSTPKGIDVINKLIHVIDPTQNTHIRDKYFGFDIDFSKCTFVFSYNDKNNVSPILLDRMRQIQFATPTYEEKKKIMVEHVIPRIAKSLNSKLVIDDETIDYILQKNADESGLRDIEKDISHLILESEIINQCNDGGQILGFNSFLLPKLKTQ